ncbi:MAG: hypothetical protein IJD84_10540 [Parabacteroides sp.]|nr:hypothetical protein [Parabacteroides sp.]
MVRLEFKNIDALKKMHCDAVVDYVSHNLSKQEKDELYAHIQALPGFKGWSLVRDETDDGWLEEFILADLSQLELWVKTVPYLLRFCLFRDLYLKRFSKDPQTFVDSHKKYNAYTLFDAMDLEVCPYCEHEFFEVVMINGKKRRTCEFDHFFPKGTNEYPALAMCFYNLVPSCKPCNQLKMANPTGANPYSDDIELLTWLYPDLPIGINMEMVKESDCVLSFHAKGGMVVNEKNLALEQRYNKHLSSEVYRLLKNKQQFSKEKIEEIVKWGMVSEEDLMINFFGRPRSEAKGKELHTKMKQDLIGW